jgi:tRNA(fMet)-specific endonuclease VapC
MLDTNACIAIIRRRPETVLTRLRGKQIGQVGVSAITVAELEYGAAKSSHPEAARDALADFLLPLEIAPFDEAAAREYGRVRHDLERRGTPIGPLDTQIAAHAVSLGATIVTANVGEFRRVKGLVVEDWAGP